jgi:hypothetical protein
MATGLDFGALSALLPSWQRSTTVGCGLLLLSLTASAARD